MRWTLRALSGPLLGPGVLVQPWARARAQMRGAGAAICAHDACPRKGAEQRRSQRNSRATAQPRSGMALGARHSAHAKPQSHKATTPPTSAPAKPGDSPQLAASPELKPELRPRPPAAACFGPAPRWLRARGGWSAPECCLINPG